MNRQSRNLKNSRVSERKPLTPRAAFAEAGRRICSQFGDAVVRLRKEIRFCKRSVHNISYHELCSICEAGKRNHSLICVVENIRDVIAIESTNQYNGVYHVLGGVISPLEGIGPEELNIDSLAARCQNGKTKEVIMALNPTIEGDTTIFYISKKLVSIAVKITSIARGISFGGELEYVDDVTLGRSIATRMPYENYLVPEMVSSEKLKKVKTLFAPFNL